MTFESKREKMLAGLQEMEQQTEQQTEQTDVDNFSRKAESLSRLKPRVIREKHETTKSFNFTLQPSVRKKLGRMAKKSGYGSASSFLNELIKNLDEEVE